MTHRSQKTRAAGMRAVRMTVYRDTTCLADGALTVAETRGSLAASGADTIGFVNTNE